MEKLTGTISALYRTTGVTFDAIKTASPAMAECLRIARQAAAVEVTIILTGESGTGKNLLAQAIHNAGNRRDEVFYAVNCGAFSETLVQSELFGHEQGAYTGADRERSGIFEIADRGTLFLDEISELGESIQSKLLQVIEYKQFRRLGGEKIVTTNTRIIAATSRSLAELQQSGRLKKELFYRLNQFNINVPPLRDRPADVAVLAEHFLRESNRKLGRNIRGFAPAAFDLLTHYPWPGNVRELKNVILRCAIVSAGETIAPDDIAPDISAAASPAPATDAEPLSMADIEKRHIEKILAATGANKKKTAELLGISRSTLDRKMEEYRINE